MKLDRLIFGEFTLFTPSDTLPRATKPARLPIDSHDIIISDVGTSVMLRAWVFDNFHNVENLPSGRKMMITLPGQEKFF